jgi:2-heptyl-3-hydroxy-4(1H)-quinolone synthase
MNMLVVGGGIGGLTAAATLSAAGHRVTLVERAARFAPVGAGLILAPNAARALASLGVDLGSRGLSLPSMDVVRANGSLLMRLETERLGREHGPMWAISRADLHEAVLGAMPRGVEIVQGLRFDDLQEVAGGVEVTFEGEPGSKRFEAVVGADGLRSRVRERLLGPQELRYSGVTCWRGISPNPGFSGAVEAWAGEARIGVVPLRGERLYYYLVKSAPLRAPELRWPAGFRAAFGRFRGGIERLFDVLREAPPLHHDLEELEAPLWGRSRVFLLGDAAHAMTPNQGQGAAMAIEDALALARALHPEIEGALARYAAARHERVRKVMLSSRRLGALAHWRSPPARWLRDGVLRLLPRAAGDAQYRRLVEPGLALLRA